MEPDCLDFWVVDRIQIIISLNQQSIPKGFLWVRLGKRATRCKTNARAVSAEPGKILVEPSVHLKRLKLLAYKETS